MSIQGRLIPMKTIYELEQREELAEAYVVEIPVKLADRMSSILRPILPENVVERAPYYFLRRIVKYEHLPAQLGDQIRLCDGNRTIHYLVFPPLPSAADIINALKPYVESNQWPIVRSTHVPIVPPTSAEQAARWSANHWPCTFNPASQIIQRAPPLHVLRATQSEIEKPARLEPLFRLAELAAAECAHQGLGMGIGAVVVDPGNDEIVAVAGDARWLGLGSSDWGAKEDCSGQVTKGRPDKHALMRAIAMVAAKELARRNETGGYSDSTTEQTNASHEEKGQTPIEKLYASINGKPSSPYEEYSGLPKAQSEGKMDAYLCAGLDIYLTHEPCVACSMAMVHSRFRACVFVKRMPQTGGLWAEKDHVGRGYGLFWRRELNWRVLTFQYRLPAENEIEDEELSCSAGDGGVEGVFNA